MSDAAIAGTGVRFLHDIPRLQAQARPDAIALVQGDMRWSYAAWNSAIEAAAEQLDARGVRRGDRVAVIGENGLVIATLIHAIAARRAWPVILNARMSAREIETILDHARVRLVICATDVSSDASSHALRLDARNVTWGALPHFAVGATRDAKTEPTSEDPARDVGALIYTSGTTGAPKGVMLTHRNLLHVAHWSGALRGMTDIDRVFAALPISHVFGLASVFLASTLYGATVHLIARFDPSSALALVAREGVTVFQGVPAMFARLLEHVRAAPAQPALRNLRYASAGGSPLDMTLKRDAERLLGTALNNGYGMTELAPTVSTTLTDQPRSDDSVGPPLPGIEIRITDALNCPVAPGAVGVLRVRGPTVMRGYYRADDATAAIIDAEGFLDTGDLARQHDDGALFIVGRAKDLIIHSGFNVHPEEIEAVLTAHHDVTLAAVIGRPAAGGNEDVIAFVQLAPGTAFDEATLRSWCAERLAPYKRPARIVALAALPASSTGKIRKTELRATASRLT